MFQLASVDVRDSSFIITCSFEDNERAKNIPMRQWDKVNKHWVAPTIRPNAMYIKNTYQDDERTNKANTVIEMILRDQKLDEFPRDYQFKGEPMMHQQAALDLAWDRTEFALFHDMGTGKTFTSIHLACARYKDGYISGLLIVCPTSIKSVWAEELLKWSTVRTSVYIYESADRHFEAWLIQPMDKMKVLIVGVESISHSGKRSFRAADAFLKKYQSMMVVDESSKIKSPQRNRTKRTIQLGELAECRLIATGTSITQGIHDLFAQFKFLNPNIVGKKTFTAFRYRYCVMGGFENRHITGYQNTRELFDLVRPYVHVIKKKDVMDLPERTYTTRMVQSTPEIRKLSRDLKEQMFAEHREHVLEVKIALDRLTRYQQLVGGFFPYRDEDADEWKIKPLDSNPKMDELLSIIEETDQKMIIWSRFVPEIEMIAARLRKEYGEQSVQTFYGKTKNRAEAISRFRTTDSCRFFVANIVTGGMGLTLIEATIMVYFSNTFSYEDRVQSNDRNYRKGQDRPVTIIDLIMNMPIDGLIQKALERKTHMANMVDDAMKEKMI